MFKGKLKHNNELNYLYMYQLIHQKSQYQDIH
jgi:hypothetical protein